MKTALVCGAGGFIGSHLVTRLKEQGFWVRGVDLKYPEFSKTKADEFIIGDLRELIVADTALTSPNNKGYDEVYQMAADMGGAGYIFTGNNDADIMHNSAQINLNICHLAKSKNISKLLYSSSACIYPYYNQQDPDNPRCHEGSAYPASPDSEYGWEKLFSERLYLAYRKNYELNTKIVRYHNIFGPEGTWQGGKEKAPAAICRKVSQTNNGENISIWGDGKQTRSFLYIDECIDGTLRLMRSDKFHGPVNIGSEEMVTINDLSKMIINVSGKSLGIVHTEGPTGVRGRNSDNTLIRKKLLWEPSKTLYYGIQRTYNWINQQACNNPRMS